VIDAALIRALLDQEMAKIRGAVGEERFRSGKFEEAAALFCDLVLADDFTEFLTLPAYERVTTLS
jgi:malate synthase